MAMDLTKKALARMSGSKKQSKSLQSSADGRLLADVRAPQIKDLGKKKLGNKKRSANVSRKNASKQDVEFSGIQSNSTTNFAEQVELEESSFDPRAPELNTSWSSYAERVFCLNAYPNGTTLSIHNNSIENGDSVDSGGCDSTSENISGVGEAVAGDRTEGAEVNSELLASHKFTPQQFHLRIRDTRNYLLPQGRYYLYRDNGPRALEKHMSNLHKSGQLSSSVVYFGTSSDPFLSLNKKFDVTMPCLEVLERYSPGLVVVQTRSPMIISAVSQLRSLRDRAVVSIPIETPLEKAIVRYTPGMPKISERLIAADGLRRQGIPVNLVVSPVLPYGKFHRDAWRFAELLCERADYISFGSLATGAESDEAQLKNFPLAQKLVADKNFRWLRPYSYRYVYLAVKAIAPEKLQLPVKASVRPHQLDLFAA